VPLGFVVATSAYQADRTQLRFFEEKYFLTAGIKKEKILSACYADLLFSR